VLKYCLITHDARIGSSPGRVVGNPEAVRSCHQEISTDKSRDHFP